MTPGPSGGPSCLRCVSGQTPAQRDLSAMVRGRAGFWPDRHAWGGPDSTCPRLFSAYSTSSLIVWLSAAHRAAGCFSTWQRQPRRAATAAGGLLFFARRARPIHLALAAHRVSVSAPPKWGGGPRITDTRRAARRHPSARPRGARRCGRWPRRRPPPAAAAPPPVGPTRTDAEAATTRRGCVCFVSLCGVVPPAAPRPRGPPGARGVGPGRRAAAAAAHGLFL